MKTIVSTEQRRETRGLARLLNRVELPQPLACPTVVCCESDGGCVREFKYLWGTNIKPKKWAVGSKQVV